MVQLYLEEKLFTRIRLISQYASYMLALDKSVSWGQHFRMMRLL